MTLLMPEAITVENHPYGRPLGHDDYYNETHPLIDEHPDLQELGNSTFAHGAEVFMAIRAEFVADGEPFQPTVDVELRDWLIETLQKEVPDITREDIVEIFRHGGNVPSVEVTERVGKIAVGSVELSLVAA